MGENAPKIIIVVLVVVVVLFVVGIGVGAGGGIGSISIDGVINSLGGMFPAPAISVSEIDSDCFNPTSQRIIIPGGGVCELEFAASSANVRSLKLQIAPGAVVHLELNVEPVEDTEMTIETDLPNDGDRQINLTLFPSGGTMIIDECVVNSGSACVIDLVS